ncbi:MAG TPA: lasso RiPP family leader peptide-containing protein [Solirubrobacteraceae bacterium]|jgi:hypothetical protein
MESTPLRTDYETPKIVDHGDLAEITAANSFTGVFDADYKKGEPVPPNGPGSQP